MKFNLPRKLRIPLPNFLKGIFSFAADHHAIILTLFLWLIIIFSIIYFTTDNRPNLWRFIQENTPGAPKPSPTPKPDDEPHADLVRIAQTQAAIVDAINNNRMSDLKSRMKDKVEVIERTKKCCGEENPQNVVERMAVLSPHIPYDFNQQNEVIMDLKNKNPELAEKFVGIASPKPKEQLVAFDIKPDGKISEVQISISWKLYRFN